MKSVPSEFEPTSPVSQNSKRRRTTLCFEKETMPNATFEMITAANNQQKILEQKAELERLIDVFESAAFKMMQKNEMDFLCAYKDHMKVVY